MSIRPALIVYAAVGAVGIAALLGAAATDQRWTAFSLNIPPAAPAATLNSGQEVCDGPLQAMVAFASVRAWLSPNAAPGASLSMRVRSAGGGTLATGQIPPGTAPSVVPTFKLTASVPAGRAISVCVRNNGSKPVTLLGSGPSVALLFLRQHPESLLALLPTVFARAALFRASWVGPWTFWLLLAGLLAAFFVGGLAVVQAVRSDARRSSTASASRDR